ncbi:MAG: hypothetical protein K0S32_141 [Bacteroidetes bacterium]|jgi:hypothetical protein|nr:hypothetical protein [Bacteroidota bacterium]
MRKLLLLFSALSFISNVRSQAPNFNFANGIGGPNGEECTEIAYDAFGNVYATGNFSGIVDFDPSAAVANLNSGSGTDIFLVKYNSSGQYQWAINIGSASNCQAHAIACDASSNIYLTGFYSGTIDFDPSASTSAATAVGASDMFVTKYNSNGQLVFGFGVGGTGNDVGRAITVNSSGIYVTGGFTGTADFNPSAATNAFTSTSGSMDMFVAKYSVAGTYVWAFPITGTASDYSESICLDASGNVFVSGNFNSTGDFDPGAGTANLTPTGSSQDCFLAKYSSVGGYLWAFRFGGANSDFEYGLCSDGSNIFISGLFNGTVDFDPSAATANLIPTGSTDIYFAKYNNSGQYLWAKNIGSGGSENAHAITCLGNDILLTGYFSGTIDMDPGPGTSNLSTAAMSDAFLARYDANGQHLWSFNCPSNIGSAGGNDVETDGNGNVWICGNYNGSVDFDPSASTAMLNSVSGGTDGFVANYFSCIPPAAPVDVSNLAGTFICDGDKASLDVTGSGTINWYGSSSATLSLGTGLNFMSQPLTTGTYTFYAEATTCATSSLTPITVTVNPLPAIVVSPTSAVICSGQNATLTASGGAAYIWNTTATTAVVVVNPGSNTSYNVVGIDNNGCMNNASVSVTVNPIPTTTMTGNFVICNGQTATLTAGGASTYTWNTGPQSTVITVTPSINTTYFVVGTSTNGCINAVVKTVTVNALPTVNIVNTSTVICAGQSATLTASGASSYSWNTGATTGNVSVSPTANTSYTVTGTNANGCSNTAATSISVNALPTVVVSSGNTTICTGQTTTLTASGASTYSWNTGATTANLSVNPTANTSYTVTGTNGTGCANTTTTSISVNALPIVLVSTGNPTICTGQSATLTANGATTFIWNTGAVTAVVVINPTVTTSYTVSGTDANNCTNTATITQNVSACTGLNEADGSFVKPLSVYPNPGNGEFWLKAETEGLVSVYDITGRLISELQINKDNLNKEQQLVLAAGVYHVVLSTGKKNYSMNLVSIK